MRRILTGIVLWASLAACGGSDFAAAVEEDAAPDASNSDVGAADVVDASAFLDGVTGSDHAVTAADVANESRADDGVTDAPGAEETTASDSGFRDATRDEAMDALSETSSDAAPERTVDAVAEAPAATCDAPTTFYRDRDKDGFGATADSTLACFAPSSDGTWSTQPGDCRDDLPTVKPNQANSPDPPKYSGIGYADPVRPLGISFDFDCDGSETADPSNMYGAAPNCGALATNCGQIGYLPADPGRSGVGINGLCGSTTLRICAAQGLNCNPMFAQTVPFRCR